MEQHSATTHSSHAAVDQDRLTIQYFEDGGTFGQKAKVELVKVDGDEESKRCATFSIKNEDHTLGNALRYIIIRNPDVEFCGYSVPHPSEAKIHLRIQTRGPAAIDVLKKGLADLQTLFGHILSTYQTVLERKNFEYAPDEEY